ncbi:MAG: hypothetical protein M1819_002958 [Sarea resinae]|nr:MAG: hypothetical protein M1819_002958 [Sarea resinae]
MDTEAARMVHEWRPLDYLQSCDGVDFALLILNQPIVDLPVFERLWQHSRFRICADGGGNRLYDLFRTSEDRNRHSQFLPDAIHGDLDSLRPDAEAFYAARGVDIKRDPDQYSTDLHKCLRLISQVQDQFGVADAGQTPPLDVVILGGLGGRVDQGFSQIHHLYMASRDRMLLIGKCLLFSEESISFLLQKGRNLIHVPLAKGYLTENIGILPVGRPAVITTRGMEWDVEDWVTEFGGQLSTSNHIRADIIEIDANERVLFTVERSSLLPRCPCNA